MGRGDGNTIREESTVTDNRLSLRLSLGNDAGDRQFDVNVYAESPFNQGRYVSNVGFDLGTGFRVRDVGMFRTRLLFDYVPRGALHSLSEQSSAGLGIGYKDTRHLFRVLTLTHDISLATLFQQHPYGFMREKPSSLERSEPFGAYWTVPLQFNLEQRVGFEHGPISAGMGHGLRTFVNLRTSTDEMDRLFGYAGIFSYSGDGQVEFRRAIGQNNPATLKLRMGTAWDMGFYPLDGFREYLSPNLELNVDVEVSRRIGRTRLQATVGGEASLLRYLHLPTTDSTGRLDQIIFGASAVFGGEHSATLAGASYRHVFEDHDSDGVPLPEGSFV